MTINHSLKVFKNFFQISIYSMSILLVSCDSGPSDSSNVISTTAGSGVTPDEVSPLDDADQATIIETSRFVDPAAQGILDSFVEDLRSRQISADLSNVTIVFVDDFGPGFTNLTQGGNTAALCFRSSGLIQVDSFFINNNSFLFEVLYHELGHCVLGMEHRSNSIMSPTVPRATSALIDEFFTEAFFFELGVLSSPAELEGGHEVMVDLALLNN